MNGRGAVQKPAQEQADPWVVGKDYQSLGSDAVSAISARIRGGALVSNTAALPVMRLKALPADLTELPNWVAWRYEQRGESRTKVPYSIRGVMASSTNRDDWTTFDDISQFFARNKKSYSGIGVVFEDGGGMAGIDLDKCLKPDGTLKDWAQPIIGRFSQTYMEVSPSGTGIKIWCRGKLPGGGVTEEYADGRVEIYDRSRYFAVTGKVFNDAPLQVEEQQSDIDWLLALVGHDKQPTATHTLPKTAFDMPAFINLYIKPFGWDVRGPFVNHHPKIGGLKWRIEDGCPFQRDYSCGSSTLGVTAKGAAYFKCWCGDHNPKTWQDVKALVGAADTHGDLRDDSIPPEAAIHAVPRGAMPKLLEMVSGYKILTTDYPPPVFVFEGLLHNGVTLLCGRPKIGKSWLALQLGLDTALGRPGLAKFPRPKKDTDGVLYIGLEESEGRTNSRMKKFVSRGSSDAILTGNLSMVYELDPLLTGGINQIDAALSTRHFGLVVIDTFLAALRQTRGKNCDALQEDYNAVKALQVLAYRHQTAIVLVHHTRKMAADYSLDRVAGTTGLTAAADSVWVLDRQAQATVLTIQGRDMADAEYALKLDQRDEAFGWAVIGTGEELKTSQARWDILEFLGESAEPQTPIVIAKELKKGRVTIRRMLSELRKEGRVAKTEEGYRLVQGG